MVTNLNMEVLDELVDIMGDDMGMLLDSYFADSLAKLKSLADMDWNTEQESIFRMAHALKGSSRNVGVVDFSDLCEEIEDMARAGALTEEVFDLQKLDRLFAQASEELKIRYL